MAADKGTKYEGDEDFTFTLTAVDDAPMPEVTTATAKAGRYATFGEITYHVPGTYYYNIAEAKGTTSGMSYDTNAKWAVVEVEEGDEPGKLEASVSYGTAKDEADEEILVVTNEYKPDTGLTVKKVVSSTRAADKTKSFKFKVTLYGDKNLKTVKKVKNGTYGDMTFKNGVAEFELKDGKSKTAKGLPAGIYYKVEETDAGGLASQIANQSGALSNKAIVATCTNTYKTSTPNSSTSGGTSSVSSRTATPKTADNTPQAMALAFGLLGALGIVASQLRRRREQ